MSEKRKAGQLKNGDWLVLTESKQQEDEGWTHQCGEEIEGVDVHHPIHDGPFPLSGSGKVHIETTPYCPKCEEKPASSGSPIKI